MTPPTTAIILAAGRGSRMGDATERQPKCLTPLLDRPLLSWQTEALRRAGLSRVVAIGGYRQELLDGLTDELLVNERWDRTNMVQTLRIASAILETEPVVVAYGDIVYRTSHVEALLRSDAEIAITADTDWLTLWSLRDDDPLADAETFRSQDGWLTEIGQSPTSVGDVEAQYMGLLRFTPEGWRSVVEVVDSDPALDWDRLDMTGLLSAVIVAGTRVGVVPVDGGWAEVDTVEDRDRYEAALVSGKWHHDWREGAA